MARRRKVKFSIYEERSYAADRTSLFMAAASGVILLASIIIASLSGANAGAYLGALGLVGTLCAGFGGISALLYMLLRRRIGRMRFYGMVICLVLFVVWLLIYFLG